MAYALTINKIGNTPITVQMARAAGIDIADVLWAADKAGYKKELRLFAADCAARVLHIFEREYPDDHRPRKSIIAARKFARGEISAAEMHAAGAAAGDAAWVASRPDAWVDSWAAGDAAGAAAGDARAATRAVAGDAAGDAEWAASRLNAWDAAEDAERKWQWDRLALWLSDDQPDDWPLPEIKNSGDVA